MMNIEIFWGASFDQQCVPGSSGKAYVCLWLCKNYVANFEPLSSPTMVLLQPSQLALMATYVITQKLESCASNSLVLPNKLEMLNQAFIP